jgi:hypothetical protein
MAPIHIAGKDFFVLLRITKDMKSEASSNTPAGVQEIRLYRPLLFISGRVEPAFLPDAEYGLAIELTSSSPSVTGVEKTLFEKGNPFLLYFHSSLFEKLSIAEEEKLFEWILLLFFSKNYIYSDGMPVLVSEEPYPSFFTGTLNRLDSFINRQGLSGVLRRTVRSGMCWKDQIGRKDLSLSVTASSLPTVADMEHSFLRPEHIGSYILFTGGSLSESIQIELSFFAVCQLFLNERPDLRNMSLAAMAEKIRVRELAGEIGTLSQRLANAYSFVEIAKTKYKDDYENVLVFYRQEYEILPLWYKRFGHIIKVLMGKRTFKSLFRDDVKKYKD